MDLPALLGGLERGPESPGFDVVRAWLVATSPASDDLDLLLDELERGPPALPELEKVRAWFSAADSVADDALFWLLARQLAYDCSGAPRLHVQCSDARPLAWLQQVSIPGSVVVAHRTLQDQHGLCFAIRKGSMERLERVEGIQSPCFLASSEKSKVFVQREPSGMVSAEHMQWVQAVGAGVHAALKRGEVDMNQGSAERLLDDLKEYYRGLGALCARAESVLALARERCIWRAAEHVLRGGTVKQLVCGKEDVAWAARQLPGVFFPKEVGEAVRRMAREIGYPERARFHAVYHDLVEDVDYNYVAVPLEAFTIEMELAPVDVFLYNAEGRTEMKRTLPVVQVLKLAFPKRVLVLRQFLEWMLSEREGIEEALTTCTAF